MKKKKWKNPIEIEIYMYLAWKFAICETYPFETFPVFPIEEAKEKACFEDKKSLILEMFQIFTNSKSSLIHESTSDSERLVLTDISIKISGKKNIHGPNFRGTFGTH
jgi:hypothetical protein